MGSKSQRKKELQARKRQEKRKKQQQSLARRQDRDRRKGGDSHERQRRRIAGQIPNAWPGEALEDVAIFDDSALAALSAELAPEAIAIREALEYASQRRDDDALKRVSIVSRGSPLSDWRLFIRGLVDWLADNADAADEAWKRLSPARRPGRIAAAMTLARHPNLEQISATTQPGQPPSGSGQSVWSEWDAQLVYHARLLRRVRFDRAALRIAENGLKIPEESTELLFGPKRIEWLRRFAADQREVEGELVAALEQAALGRAFAQNYSDMFEEAAATFQGPRHDRRNRLLSFFYFGRYRDDRAAERKSQQALDTYLNRELPQNEALTSQLRSAIASQIHLKLALAEMQPDRGEASMGMMGFMFGPPEDTKAIRKHLLAAVKAAPANRAAYRAYVDWIESKLADERLKKPARTPLESELAEVMRNWTQGAPDDVEPRLFLVDMLLEEEQLAEARPHVEFLAASRQDDPRVRATPWKWQLLEAMRLCRRKSTLAEVPARLDEAEKLWPAWLSKQWLPYLQAAWTMRTGQAEAFEEARTRICEQSGLARDSLPDACLMLGAAQAMRLPAGELKRFRDPLEQALQQLQARPLDELLETGRFFWDLHRVQLLYPAYRMHGSKIGTALIARLSKSTQRVLDALDDERMQGAVLWGSEHRFWPTNYDIKFPPFFSRAEVQRHPIFAAAQVNALLKNRYPWGIEKYRALGPLLREAASSQRDAYYRHWFIELADDLDETVTREASRFSGGLGNLFGNLGKAYADEIEDEDDDLPAFDPDCNCPSCRAARAKAKKHSSGPMLF